MTTATRAAPKYATIPEWGKLTGYARTRTYQDLSDGKLRAIKLGKRVLIDVEHGLAYMATLPEAKIRIGKPTKAA